MAIKKKVYQKEDISELKKEDNIYEEKVVKTELSALEKRKLKDKELAKKWGHVK